MSVRSNHLFGFFSQIYLYREYLLQSVMRDLRLKYKRSVLGYVWTMLHPLAMMIIIAVVFASIMNMPTKDYAVFLFAGLLPWNFFQSTTMMSLGSIRANARLFGQIPVPKYIFIISIACSNLVNFTLALVPLIILTIAFGRQIPPTIAALPVVMLPFFCVVIGVALILATASVFFDDTLHLAEVAMQALYFMCPVLYHRDLLPERVVNYLALNPLFQHIEFIRAVLYNGVLPDPRDFALNSLASLLILAIGLLIFKRNEDKFLYFV